MPNIHGLIKTRDPILCIYKKTAKQTNKQKNQ